MTKNGVTQYSSSSCGTGLTARSGHLPKYTCTRAREARADSLADTKRRQMCGTDENCDPSPGNRKNSGWENQVLDIVLDDKLSSNKNNGQAISQ